jgi:hypothetical protein
MVAMEDEREAERSISLCETGDASLVVLDSAPCALKLTKPSRVCSSHTGFFFARDKQIRVDLGVKKDFG